MLAALAAGCLAFFSRTPASVRAAGPPSGAYDATRGAGFTDEEIARHGAYRGPAYLYTALAIVLELVTLVALVRSLVPRLAERIATIPGGWLTQVAVVAAVVVAALTLVTIPLDFVRGYVMERAWALSTQDLGGWVGDRLRVVLVALVTGIIPTLAFFGIVRWFPRTWWLWGWGTFTFLTIVLAFLWPVLIAPLFNRFTPLPDGSLKQRVVALASKAGVGLDDVLVADASKRSTAENAYVAGIGSTKRMVLYDTLLESGTEAETAYVAAHELGHEVHSHIWKSLAIASAGLLAGFAVLAWLAPTEWFLRWAGAGGVEDVRLLPALVLFAFVAGLVVTPLQNFFSRGFEREADRVAIELTEDPGTAIETYRRLGLKNLADLRPPGVAVALLFTHPPIPERIADILDAARDRDSS